MPVPDIQLVDGLDINQTLSLAYCRTYAQYCVMLERYRSGVCTFCDPLDPEKNKLVAERGDWRMWVNPFPLPHTSVQLVMAPRRHVAPGGEILSSDFTRMGELFDCAQKQFGFTGGGFVMRFGTPLQSAGTVLHLHANIIIPDQTGDVVATFAKAPEKIEMQFARMRVFEKLRQGTSLHLLTQEELRLVMGRL